MLISLIRHCIDLLRRVIVVCEEAKRLPSLGTLTWLRSLGSSGPQMAHTSIWQMQGSRLVQYPHSVILGLSRNWIHFYLLRHKSALARNDEKCRGMTSWFATVTYSIIRWFKLGTDILQPDGHQLRYVPICQNRQRTSQEPYYCESGSAPVHLESGGGARITLGANRHQFSLDDKLRSR